MNVMQMKCNIVVELYRILLSVSIRPMSWKFLYAAILIHGTYVYVSLEVVLVDGHIPCDLTADICEAPETGYMQSTVRWRRHAIED